MKIKLKENNISNVIFGNSALIIKEKELSDKLVKFYDYDGRLLYEYDYSQFLALNSLPPLPNRTSENLTCDEWNWTLQEIIDQINYVGGDINVGATYHTTDDKTYITHQPTETYSNVSINLTPTVDNAVTVDWGDGSAVETWETANRSATKTHTYTNVTDSSVYDIVISCSSGTYYFYNGITGIPGIIYAKFSNKVTSMGSSGVRNNCYLKTITLPNSVTKTYFSGCKSLYSLVVPRSITSLGRDFFYSVSSLKVLCLPGNTASFDQYCFEQGCSSLYSITIPNSVTSLGNYCFSSCNIQHINIPGTITTLPQYCLQTNKTKYVNIREGVITISSSCFRDLLIEKVVIPSTVTTLGTQCFYGCNSLKRIYMQPTTPPTMSSTNAIPNNANLVIYVPKGTLSAYQSASNWSTYSSKMVEYDY